MGKIIIVAMAVVSLVLTFIPALAMKEPQQPVAETKLEAANASIPPSPFVYFDEGYYMHPGKALACSYGIVEDKGGVNWFHREFKVSKSYCAAAWKNILTPSEWKEWNCFYYQGGIAPSENVCTTQPNWQQNVTLP